MMVKQLHGGCTHLPISGSKDGVEELLSGGAWGLWLLRLLRLDAFLFY